MQQFVKTGGMESGSSREDTGSFCLQELGAGPVVADDADAMQSGCGAGGLPLVLQRSAVFCQSTSLF
jgi:hypothetical protein